jgi:acyl-CoA synthetase (AMP-forming)/AMP-acid ligase II
LLALAPQYQDVLNRYQARYVMAATSVLPASVREGLFRAFNAPLVNSYGATEIGRMTQKIEPVGSPLTETSGVVLDPERTRIMLDGSFQPPGHDGEIVVHSNDFTGYWHNPEANAEAFFGEWFRTGDLGRIDVDGNLTIVGRVKEVINSGGAKISPYEIEAVLRQHPQVTDAVVFGIHHAEMGETVAAAVVGKVSERELRKFAAERLPFYKVPMRILSVDAIPMLESGKVQRNRMAEVLGLK